MNWGAKVLLGILVSYTTLYLTYICCCIGETRPEYTVTWEFPIIMLVITIFPAVLGYLIGFLIGIEVVEE